jgi:hypothetical protein
MSPLVKIPRSLLIAALADLERPHPFALERLGFFSFKQSLDARLPLLLCHEYHPIPDNQYVRDPSCAARINGAAIQAAMGRSFRTLSGQMWVHSHSRHGCPSPSPTDHHEGPRVAQSCANAQPKALQAWAVLSEDGIAGQVRGLDGKFTAISGLSVVGWPMGIPPRPQPRRRSWGIQRLFRRRFAWGDQYDRQSFLGPDAQNVIRDAKIGLVGLGGGGSHINQQLAHIGFQRLVLCDEQQIESTNLNRLVGATVDDVLRGRHKTKIASRVFWKVQPGAEIDDHPMRWEEKRDALRGCDFIFGAIDGFTARRDLEAFCRAHMIPLIDIGMTVLRPADSAPEIRGQAILSMPGELCMHCIQFLTPENLAKEAQDYNAGPRPQVVWPNGALASSAIGYAMLLLTGWAGPSTPLCRVDHTGSQLTIERSNLVAALKGQVCRHFPLAQTGDPDFRKL